MPNWEEILKTDVATVEPPKPLPTGTYVFAVNKATFGESSKKKTPQVAFEVKVVDVKEDVDKAALAEFSKKQNLATESLELIYYFTDKSLHMLRKFVEACGVKIGGGKTFADCIPETTGAMFVGTIKHTPMDSGNIRYEIDSFSVTKFE